MDPQPEQPPTEPGDPAAGAEDKPLTPKPDAADGGAAGGGTPAGSQPGGGEVQPQMQLININVPLPETINIDRMARISDVKSVWRSGIKQIEEIFAEHIAKINDMFDDRALEYDRIRDQLITNHEFLKRFYMDMQRELDAKQ